MVLEQLVKETITILNQNMERDFEAGDASDLFGLA